MKKNKSYELLGVDGLLLLSIVTVYIIDTLCEWLFVYDNSFH